MTAIVNSYGELISIISGNAETIKLNTPEGCRAVDDPPRHPMRYNGTSWEDLPPSPGAGYAFDYSAKQWIDPRTLDEIKAQKWAEIKSQRDQLEFSGFEFEGGIYDSDQVSQGRIMGAAAAGMDQVWTLADNTTTYLTANELVQLYQALQMHIAITHQRGRAAREAIMSATTKDEVESITL